MIAQTRGKNVALIGVFLQLILAGVMLIVWLWTGSIAAKSATWMLACGLPLWLFISLLFYCRQLERRESLELEQADDAGGKIFEGPEGGRLRVAASRAAWLERWGVPIFTLLWMALQVAVGILALRAVIFSEPETLTSPHKGGMIALVVAFAGFLFSRYATGMGRTAEWRYLRSAGNYLLINVLLIAGVVVALFGTYMKYMHLDGIIAYIAPVVQIIFGAELALNFVLDIYRPRLPGQVHTPPFDSHLFALVAEPERIGHSIADAMNYQFGFEVSRTWFFKLLSRAFVPLIIFAVAVMFAMSSIVMVQSGEEYVVFHFGKMQSDTLKAGVHLKWPWPVDTIVRFNTSEVKQVILGVGKPRGQRTDIIPSGTFKGRQMFLWTEEHGAREETNFLLAAPRSFQSAMSQQGGKEQAPPVYIVKLGIIIQYVVEDVKKYGFKYANARELLEDRAYQEMLTYFTSATLDEAIPGDRGERPEAIMTFGQEPAIAELQRRLEKAFGPEGLDLGVRITWVGVQVVHPPKDVAPDFEAVIAAARRYDEQIYAARGVAHQILGYAAGSSDNAWDLALAVRSISTLITLRSVRDNSSDFNKVLASSVDQANRDIVDLKKVVDTQRLLGLLRPGQTTAEQDLLKKYQTYLAMLNDIAKNKRDFDFAGAIASVRKDADAIFRKASGKIASEMAAARADRWEKEMSVRELSEPFQRNLKAYEANPSFYTLSHWLDVLDRTLPERLKYVLCVPRDRVQLWVNWEREAGILQRATFGAEELSK